MIFLGFLDKWSPCIYGPDILYVNQKQKCQNTEGNQSTTKSLHWLHSF